VPVAGQEVVIRNSDNTLHNVMATPKNNEPFNVGQPVKGLRVRTRPDKPELLDVNFSVSAFEPT